MSNRSDYVLVQCLLRSGRMAAVKWSDSFSDLRREMKSRPTPHDIMSRDEFESAEARGYCIDTRHTEDE